LPGARASFLLRTAELVEKWDDFAALLQSTIDSQTGNLSANVETLVDNMLAAGRSEVVRAKVLLAHELCAPAERLIKAASCDIRSLPFNFWVWFQAWLDALHIDEFDVADYVGAILASKGLKLNPKQLQEVSTATLTAVVEAKKRPYWHLFEDVTVLDSDGAAAKIHEVLGVYRRREKFTIDAFHLPASIAALVAEWGLDAVRSFVVPLWTAFHGALPSPAEARQSISSRHPSTRFICVSNSVRDEPAFIVA
jgi:hypothetical protein